MAGFTLDTSGEVAMPSAHGGTVPFRWNGIDPFTQGYVEALFTDRKRGVYRLVCEGTHLETVIGRSRANIVADRLRARHGAPVEHQPAPFSDLAPETLARIMEDCRRAAEIAGTPGTAEDGKKFYTLRQQGWQGFPPLVVYLGDDGKVYLREGG